jgi:hypothetical protein
MQFMLPATGSTATQAIRVLLEQRAHRVQVVEARVQGQFGQFRRHARRSRYAEGLRPAAGLDQEAVGVAVVIALELDETLASGGRARQPERAHRRLGARIDHAYPLQRRHELADPLGHGHLAGTRRAEAQSVGDGPLHRLDDVRMGVAADHRPPGTDVVDITLAVDIENARALGAIEEQRLTADAGERAHR